MISKSNKQSSRRAIASHRAKKRQIAKKKMSGLISCSDVDNCQSLFLFFSQIGKSSPVTVCLSKCHSQRIFFLNSGRHLWRCLLLHAGQPIYDGRLGGRI